MLKSTNSPKNMPLSQPAKIPGFTVGSVMPEYPNIGDIWVERNNFEGYKNEWFWDGSKWLSNQLFVVRWSFAQGLNASTNDNTPMQQAVIENHNLYLVSFFSCVFVISPNNNTGSNWTFSISRVSTSNAITSLSSISTASKSPGIWLKANQAINTLLNIASGLDAPILRLDVSKFGSVGILYGGMSMSYRLARP